MKYAIKTLDSLFVSNYDSNKCGGEGEIVFTHIAQEAKEFKSYDEAVRFYRRIDKKDDKAYRRAPSFIAQIVPLELEQAKSLNEVFKM
mgnify:CR=1 FL=1